MEAGVEELKGVGPKTAAILKKFGIKTVRDFFYNLPRDYENYARPISISQIRPGKVVVRGKIDSLTTRRAKKRNLSITEGVVRDQTGAIKVVWFNQGYRVRQFEPEREYYFAGTYELKNGRYNLISPSAILATDLDPLSHLSPIYVAHGKLKSRDFRRLINNSRDRFATIPDLLPTVRPGTRKNALFRAHFPDSTESVEVARKYLAYEELFELILAVRLNRQENDKLKAWPIPFDKVAVRALVASLPFQLTNAQRWASWEIFQDLAKATPMNRLLQGDVGSGKTVVAAMAAYAAAKADVQVALLAPTAILATQHYLELKKLLEPFRITVALLTGATKQKKALKTALAKGQINLVVGTHALLTDDTEFLRLGLVIIDEQHRFGVEQRQKLALKSPPGLAPHLLSMTATPIPRSLQLTLFGDLDVSILNQLPQGRQPVTTKILTELELDSTLYPKMREVLALPPDIKGKGQKMRGQQIYWICKAIEEGGALEITSVKKRARRLAAIFPKHRVEFLHGKMKPAEKDAIMEKFATGEIDILVSTTVVEVGVDVPNATLIVVENAEAYGLAQLHQLRGRVGRGMAEAFCYLLIPGDAHPTRRLLELAKSNDGFHLAEVDLRLRGPGEIYGSLQHGALDLRIASLSDTKLIHRAQVDVGKFLQNPENTLKYKELMRGITKYQQLTTLN